MRSTARTFRPLHSLALGAAIASLLFAASCTKKNEQLVDGGDTTALRVGGTLDGLPSTGQLSLTLNGGETLMLSENGAFQFDTIFDDGDTYVVILGESPADTTCEITNASGTIVGASVSDVSVACISSNAQLSDLKVSSVVGLAPAFASAQLSYDLGVSALVQEVVVTPTAIDPNATIEVNGTAVNSGEASQPIALALGQSVLNVVVTSSASTTETYALTTNRGTRILEQIAYAKASNTASTDHFGASVALSGDTLVVGAPGEEGASTGINGDQGVGANASGAVYVFRRAGDVWTQDAYIKASNAQTIDNFGIGVALDGDTLVVGAEQEDSSATGVNGDETNNTLSNSGAVYVFRRTGVTWVQEAYLKASNRDADDRFGRHVAIAGNTLAVGVQKEGSSATGINGDQNNNSAPQSGAVYVFRRSGASWAQEAYLKASNTEGSDLFGFSVALSGDTLIASAMSEDSNAVGIDGTQSNNSASESGAAYVFQRSGSTWTQQAYLKASNSVAGGSFGSSVAISGDTAVVGALTQNASRGAAYVFRRSGATWAEEAIVVASNADTTDFFGDSVALSNDTLAVSAPFEASATSGINGDSSSNGAASSGAVYLYTRTGSTWTERTYIKASNPAPGDDFGLGLSYGGTGIALSVDTLAVGAHREDSTATGIDGAQGDNTATDSGAVYVFQ